MTSQLDKIKERRSKVPAEWNISRNLAVFSLTHIDSSQYVDDYWRQYDEHFVFMRNAAKDIDYLLGLLELKSTSSPLP